MRSFITALVLTVCLAGPLDAQPARRVKDIGQTAQTASNSLLTGIGDRRAVGNYLYFTIDDGSSGAELWKSDGTRQGTDIVADIAPGSLSSSPSGFTELNGLIYFAASEPLTGSELWVTDGTTVGTRQVKDIQPGIADSFPAELTVFAGRLYFVADDGLHGRELWMTDGTPDGTEMVQDLWPGPASSSPYDLKIFAGALYFFASQPDGTFGFFRLSSGSFTPTLIRSFPPVLVGRRPPLPFGPGSLAVVGDDIAFFEGTDRSTGIELWKTDGTAAGTMLVKDINPGLSNSFPDSIVAGEGRVFFHAIDATGSWLWTSDGSAAGTKRVPPPSPGSQVLEQTALLGFLNTHLVVMGIDLTRNVSVLVQTDGTQSGTVALHEFPLFAITYSAVVGEDLYFSAGDATTGVELWRTDGTPNGTVLVRDIRPGPADSFPAALVEFSGKLFFFASDGRANSSLWSSDGSPAGTQIIRDISLPGSKPSSLAPSASGVFFAAFDASGQTERLWISDGSEGGTQQLSPAVLQTQANFPSPNMAVWRDELYFSASDIAGIEPWKSDGTPDGTKRLKDIWPGVEGSTPAAFTSFQNALVFFAADPAAGVQLWKTDGTEAGTSRVTDNPDLSPGQYALVPAGQFLFFTSDDAVHGLELWRSDGSSSGTVLVKDINPGADGSFPGDLTAFSGSVYFAASDDAHGDELWRSDGTEAGTALVDDIAPGPPSSAPFDLTVVGQTLFFTTGGGTSGLWKSDGVETVLVKSFPAPVYNLTSSGGQLFFVADDGLHGNELWRSDGTTDGTRLVLDILPGPASSSPTALFDAGGILIFAATDREHGTELWRSDGTEVGTFLIQDINPGPRSSNPSGFALAGDSVFFAADDGSSGSELWVIPLSALSPTPSERVRSTREVPFRH